MSFPLAIPQFFPKVCKFNLTSATNLPIFSQFVTNCPYFPIHKDIVGEEMDQKDSQGRKAQRNIF